MRRYLHIGLTLSWPVWVRPQVVVYEEDDGGDGVSLVAFGSELNVNVGREW